MLREIAHSIAGIPLAIRLKAKLPQAELYDEIMSRGEAAGMATWRRELTQGLSGQVLEVGAGTGLMFPHYPEGLEVTALEPDETFLALARPRAASARARVSLVPGTVESLPFDAGRFDAIVIALVLCSVPSVPRALREIARVLRPGGEVRLIEHVRSPRPVAGALMSLFDPIWLHLNGQGCHMSRDTEASLRAAGYDLLDVQPFQVFAPGLPAFPMRFIRAVPPR